MTAVQEEEEGEDIVKERVEEKKKLLFYTMLVYQMTEREHKKNATCFIELYMIHI